MRMFDIVVSVGMLVSVGSKSLAPTVGRIKFTGPDAYQSQHWPCKLTKGTARAGVGRSKSLAPTVGRIKVTGPNAKQSQHWPCKLKAQRVLVSVGSKSLAPTVGRIKVTGTDANQSQHWPCELKALQHMRVVHPLQAEEGQEAAKSSCGCP